MLALVSAVVPGCASTMLVSLRVRRFMRLLLPAVAGGVGGKEGGGEGASLPRQGH